MSENSLLTGAWNVNPILLQDGEFPVGFDQSFMQAFEGLDGAGYKPLVYCGSQLVHGTNHMLICQQTIVTQQPIKHLVKVVIHQGLPTERMSPTIVAIERLM